MSKMLNASVDRIVIIGIVIVFILLLGIFSFISHVKAAKLFAQVQYTYNIGDYQRVIEFIPKSGPFKYCIFVGSEFPTRVGGGGLVCSMKPQG